MNTVVTLQTIYYFRSSRTIEKMLVSNKIRSKHFYVYNYDGYSFRLFETKREVSDFFNFNIESKYHFDTEQSLENYLSNILIP